MINPLVPVPIIPAAALAAITSDRSFIEMPATVFSTVVFQDPSRWLTMKPMM